MRTLVHAGFHKTGTTSIQAFLSQSTAWLATRGIDYPLAGRDAAQAHHALACACAGERGAGGPNDLFVPERQAFCVRCPCQPDRQAPGGTTGDFVTRIYSSEIFATFDATEVRCLIARLGPVDFVLYYRGGIDFLYSCWAAKVRWGATMSFREFLDDCMRARPGSPIAGAFACVDNLVAEVGSGHVELRSYDAACRHAQGIVGDFAEHVLGLPGDVGLAMPRMNRTPAPVQIELIRALTLVLDEAGGPAKVYPRLTSTLQREPEACLLTDELYALIAPLMRPLSIDDMGRSVTVLDDRGNVRAPATRGADMFRDWSFPRDQVCAQVGTPVLLDALATRPALRELLDLIATTD
jgi:hypothetical protein